MSKSLTPQQLARIEDKIAAGLYHSTDEVLDKALDLLDEFDAELAEIRNEVQEGIDQFDQGNYTDYDEPGLRDLAERIKAEGRAMRKSEDRRMTS